jgi:(R,R)-butanediol dehydrogenase/meso-butanediol dehydrogenase/diacetyl reductase
VAVLGGGPIGIGVALGLRALGVESVVVAEPAPARRAAIGALEVARAVEPDPSAILDALDGRVDLVVDAAGVPAAFGTAVEVLAPRGRCVVVAMYREAVTFHPVAPLTREIRISWSCAYGAGDFSAVIGHMTAGRYPTSSWVEHVRLDELDAAFGRLERGEAVKLIVDMA